MKLSVEEEKQLKADLVQAQRDHTVKTKEGESDTWLYLQRMVQRRSQTAKGSRVGSNKPKSIASMKREIAKKNETAKWGKGNNNRKETKNVKKTKYQKNKDDITSPPLEPHQIDAQAMLHAWDNKMIDITFDEDTDNGDVVEIFNMYHEGLFDETKQESLKTMMKSERVAYPIQLGDWITLTINGREKSGKCNCER